MRIYVLHVDMYVRMHIHIYIYIYMYIHIYIYCFSPTGVLGREGSKESSSRGAEVCRAAELGTYSLQGGAVETGCSGLYGVIY